MTNERGVLNCQYQPPPGPAVNYYANSIYLSRDVPLLFRNENIRTERSLTDQSEPSDH